MDQSSDFVVKDLVNGVCFWADHLLKNSLERLTSDPSCTPDKAEEYAEAINKVRGQAHCMWLSHMTKVCAICLSDWCVLPVGTEGAVGEILGPLSILQQPPLPPCGVQPLVCHLDWSRG